MYEALLNSPCWCHVGLTSNVNKLECYQKAERWRQVKLEPRISLLNASGNKLTNGDANSDLSMRST